MPVKLLKIKVIPHASRDEVKDLVGDELKVRVQAPAESGRANKAVTKLLADYFKVSPKSVRIVSGALSPHKLVEICIT